jgi:ABC-2 type transport system permease protein
MSKAITNEPADAQTGLRSPVPEVAPSRLREDEPGLPRTFGLAGAVLLIFGSMALGFHLYGKAVRVNPGVALFLMGLGLCGLLYHAAFDRDVAFRRLYLAFSLALLAVGAVLSLLPIPKELGDQLRYGAPCLLLALFFFLSAHRNEDDPGFRKLLELVFGGAGALLAVGGLLGGNLQGAFLLPMGVVFSVLGALYLTSFIASRGVADDHAYYAALGMTAAGLIVIVVAVVRAFVGPGGSAWFTSFGVILLAVGLGYTLLGGGLASDSTLLILVRRELGAFFFSPITYLVLFGFTFFWFISWYFFVQELASTDPRNPPIEPIVRSYLFQLFPVIMVIVSVPVLTMSVFSEESRSGTLEVLLTAPVSEGQVVFSKFLAALITYMVTWVPAGLYLLAIPLSGGNAFDYKPLLSYLVCMLVWSAGFVSMGLFFSSLTRNLLVAAVLCGAGMVVLTFIYFPAHHPVLERDWGTVLTHMSYLDTWLSSLEGKIVPRFLLFPATMTVLFLFLTYKVLESRKWR